MSTNNLFFFFFFCEEIFSCSPWKGASNENLQHFFFFFFFFFFFVKKLVFSLISPLKHTMWVLIRSVLERFLMGTTTYVFFCFF